MNLNSDDYFSRKTLFPYCQVSDGERAKGALRSPSPKGGYQSHENTASKDDPHLESADYIDDMKKGTSNILVS